MGDESKAAQEQTKEPDPQDATILLVDDEPVNVKLLERTLQTFGYRRLVCTTDPRTVAGLFGEHDFDLVILDLNMPYMDGFQVMRQLQALGQDDLPPILILTAQVEQEHRLRALQSGAHDYVTKPFVVEELMARVRNLLQVQLYRKAITGRNQWLEQRVRDSVREKMAILSEKNEQLGLEVAGRVRAQEALQRLNQELETRVEQRTAELVQTVATLTDTRKELLEAEKLASLGAMVAGISHELNTPIGNAVTVSSSLHARVEEFRKLVEKGALRRTDLAEFLDLLEKMADLILRSMQRAAGLITSFKQVAIDRESERKRSFDLQELVHDVVTSLMPGMRHLAVDVTRDIPPGLVCNSYPGPVGQVLTNLIQNAVLHGLAGRERGTIRIRAEAQGPQVVITVSDDGVGMSEHTLKHAFDPFFTTRMGQGGSGLGLSVSHRIATSILGGSLGAQSTLGAGSSFRFSFLREAPA